MIRRALPGLVQAGILSALFVSFFSSTTTFFNTRYGADSAIFRLIGTAMSEGQTVYVDIWDHKGPGLFLIQWLAQEIKQGRVGIFLLQILSLAATLWLLGKIATRFLNKFLVLVTQIAFLGLLAPVYEFGNLTEEWSLPFSLFALWALTRAWEPEGKNASYLVLAVSGGALGFLFFVRLNNAAAIIAAFLAYFIYVLVEKRQFWRQLLAALAGFFAVCTAFVLGFAAIGALPEMLHATFLFNFKYQMGESGAVPRSLENGYLLIALGLVALTLLGGLVDAQLRKRPWYLVLSLCLTIVGFAATLGAGTSFYHYLQLLVPGAAIGVALLLQIFTDKMRLIAGAVVLALAVIPVFEFAKYTEIRTATSGEKEMTAQVKDIMSNVPKSELGDVFTWNVSSQYYLVMDTLPLHRFYTLQDWWGKSDPMISEELEDFFAASPPNWVLTPKAGIGNETISDQVDSEFSEVASNDRFVLWRRDRVR